MIVEQLSLRNHALDVTANQKIYSLALQQGFAPVPLCFDCIALTDILVVAIEFQLATISVAGEMVIETFSGPYHGCYKLNETIVCDFDFEIGIVDATLGQSILVVTFEDVIKSIAMDVDKCEVVLADGSAHSVCYNQKSCH